MRHIVFVRPQAFVVLDEVETARPMPIQFLLHTVHPFEVDEAQRIAWVRHDPALARVHLLEPGAVEFAQTDRFTPPPEPEGRGEMPDQSHLTCSYAATAPERHLLTVIAVGRSGREAALPEVERIEEEQRIGARIGEATVIFRLEGGRVVGVSGRSIGGEGDLTWFEHSP